jgi:hypothetical protein
MIDRHRPWRAERRFIAIRGGHQRPTSARPLRAPLSNTPKPASAHSRSSAHHSHACIHLLPAACECGGARLQAAQAESPRKIYRTGRAVAGLEVRGPARVGERRQRRAAWRWSWRAVARRAARARAGRAARRDAWRRRPRVARARGRASRALCRTRRVERVSHPRTRRQEAKHGAPAGARDARARVQSPMSVSPLALLPRARPAARSALAAIDASARRPGPRYI